MAKYRFDDAYGKVYEYDKGAGAYLFIGSYFWYSLDANMTDGAKTKRVNQQERS